MMHGYPWGLLQGLAQSGSNRGRPSSNHVTPAPSQNISFPSWKSLGRSGLVGGSSMWALIHLFTTPELAIPTDWSIPIPRGQTSQFLPLL